MNPTPTMSRVVIGGIDTHKDLHVAAVIDTAETVLATHSFSTTRAGYRTLVNWLRTFGDVARIGVEGTGSYGAGICRHLVEAGMAVWEVDPGARLTASRQHWRQAGIGPRRELTQGLAVLFSGLRAQLGVIDPDPRESGRSST